MSALDIVRAGGRSLDRRLDRVSGRELLAGLRAAGAVSEPEVAALGRPDSGGWARRLRALAVAKGDRTCRALLSVLEGLEGPPRPGPFDFYDPQRDSAPAHRSDCACCQCEEEEGARTREEGPEEEEGARTREEGPEEEEEEGEPKNDHEGPDDDEGGGDEGPDDEDEGPRDEDEGPEDEDGGDEGPDDDEDGGDEGPNEDEGPKDEDEGPEDDDDGGDEGPDDDEGGGGDED